MDNLEIATVNGGLRLRDHEHAQVHVVVVLSGGFSEHDGHSWREVTPGQLRFSAGARHDIDFAPVGARCLILQAGHDFPTPALSALSRPRFDTADSWLLQLAHRIDRTVIASRQSSSIVLDGLCTEFFAQLERRVGGRRAPPPPWLARVREQLHDARGMVSVSELAADAQVHRVHLARAFRDHFGVPITAYARRIQLDTAHQLLLSTPMPLSQVAAVAGFADQSHLTRTMRSALGLTPGGIRRQALHRFKTAAPAVG